MINNVTQVDLRLQQMNVAKAVPSPANLTMPPILGFKTPQLKEKALLKVKKFKRGDNIVIVGNIDDDYVDIVEEEIDSGTSYLDKNFFLSSPDINKRKMKYLKSCYVIDYLQSPKTHCGLGTEAIKNLAEKAMFDPAAEGRIVTFSAPVWRESSPAIFFYKLGFRFIDDEANKNIEECLIKKIPDTPPQTGMMYLPKVNLHKLLRYGDLY